MITIPRSPRWPINQCCGLIFDHLVRYPKKKKMKNLPMSFSSDLYDGWCFRTNSDVPIIAKPIKRMRMIRLHVHRMAKAFSERRGFVHLIVDWLLVVLCSDTTLYIKVCSSQARFSLSKRIVHDFNFICIK